MAIFGYDDVGDMFDGGGKGGSGDTFSSGTNEAYQGGGGQDNNTSFREKISASQQDKVDKEIANNPGAKLDGNTVTYPDGSTANKWDIVHGSNPGGDGGGGGNSGGGSGQGAAASAFVSTPFDPQTVLDFAKTAGMVESDAQIAELLADPGKWMSDRKLNLADIVPTLDADTAGANLDADDPAYRLTGDVSVDPNSAIVSTSGDVTQGTVTNYDADTLADRLGTDETTVDAVQGTVSDDALVTAEQIDMTGAATGVNADGTISVTGEALNRFATQDISKIIDTTTVAGKLLAQKLGEGNYTDSKATVLGQMKIISDEFKDTDGNPVIPPWAQALARDTARTMAFTGITGTAQTAAMSAAIMEATLGVADKEAAFFQTITTKNLDNRQQAILNKANVLSKFEVANLDARQATVVQNAKAFLDMDMANLTREQQSEVINTQAMVDALLTDTAAINAQRLFSATAANDFQKYYDNMNATISMHRSEQINSMNKFNTGEINDAAEYNATMEDSRQRFYSEMQYSIDLANAKWRQTVATTNTEMTFEAHTLDVKNTLDISTEAMNQMWDRIDNMLDYIFKGSEGEANRDAQVLAAQLSAQASGGSSSSGIWGAIGQIGAAIITTNSDMRLKENIEFIETHNGIRWYSWDWNAEAKRLGRDFGPTVGVMAQEVQKTHPQAIVEGPHGYLMVNYGELK